MMTWMEKLIPFIFIIFFLISCKDDPSNTIEIFSSNVESTLGDSEVAEVFNEYQASVIPEPFDIAEIESLEFTSGGRPQSELDSACHGLRNGSWGRYYLIDRDHSDDLGRPIGGTITVQVGGKMEDWQSDDTTQIIWEIHLVSDVISVWDSIHVGLPREDVQRFGKIHHGFCVKKGDFYYSCDFNNFSVLYKFRNDTLCELTVSRACNSK